VLILVSQGSERLFKGSVFIDLDQTIIEERAIQLVGRVLGSEELILKILLSKEPEYIRSQKIAFLLKGLDLNYVLRLVYETVRFKRGIDEFIRFLIKNNFMINIVTLTYKQIAETIIKKFRDVYGFDITQFTRIYAPVLEVDGDNKITGRIIVPTELSLRLKIPFCIECSLCKRFIVRKEGFGDIISIGDARPDTCMFIESHYSILITSSTTPKIAFVNSSFIARDFVEALEILKKIIK
jgi:phosphoserine phosphatase